MYSILYRFYIYAEQLPLKGVYGAVLLLTITEFMIAGTILLIIQTYAAVALDFKFTYLFWILIIVNSLLFLVKVGNSRRILEEFEKNEKSRKEKTLVNIKLWLYGSIAIFFGALIITPIHTSNAYMQRYNDSIKKLGLKQPTRDFGIKDSDTTDAITLMLEKQQRERQIKDSILKDSLLKTHN
ncbi:MAG: hypothetical protein V4642_00425 [Bacteroidota bacterium]